MTSSDAIQMSTANSSTGCMAHVCTAQHCTLLCTGRLHGNLQELTEDQ